MRTAYLALIFTLVLSVLPARADSYYILSADLPPWTINEQNGVFVEIVAEIERRIGNHTKVRVVPWSRAQYMATDKTTKAIIFPMARLASREDKYIWIAKIFPARFAFCSDRYPNLNIHTARKYRIAVHENAPPELFLKEKGYSKLLPVPFGVGTIPKMLDLGRVDAWFSEVSLIDYGVQGTPLKGKVECGPNVFEVWQYIAGSKNISDEVVIAYQKAVKDMHAEGVIERIMLKYLSPKAITPFEQVD